MISTQPNIEWDFTCSYDTQYEVDESLTVQAATISTEFTQTNAQFDFNFDFYTDGLFEEVLDSDLVSYQVGQNINFGRKYRVFYQNVKLKFNFSNDEPRRGAFRLDMGCIQMRSHKRRS